MVDHWYVFYTKSRHEKNVRDELNFRGFEVFLPLQKVMRQWSDRKKKVEVPLFNSYIFVKCNLEMVPFVNDVPGVSWPIRYNNKPAFLREKELEMIKRFLTTGLFVETFAIENNLEAGMRVKVMDGPLRNLEGMLLQYKNGNKFLVALEAIGQVMAVKIDIHLLKKLK